MPKKDTITCFGELVVDCFGSIEEGFLPKFGGAPGNTSVGLAKLGVKEIEFVGKVGKDFFGDFLDNTLQSYGVDTTNLYRSTNAKTTLAFVSLRAGGHRDFSFYSGAHDRMNAENVKDLNLEHTRILQFGSLTQANTESQKATNLVLEKAQKNKAYISYDPNIRAALWDDLEVLRAVIVETMPKVDMMKLNEEELEFMTGTSDPKEAAAALWKDNFQLLLLTLGEKGAYWKTATGEGLVSTARIKPVDTTGAGDAFNAGLLSQLYPYIKEGKLEISEEQINAAIYFANRVASLSTLKKGAIEALPTLEDVERVIG